MKTCCIMSIYQNNNGFPPFPQQVTKEDIGISIMYKDFYMTGWSCRDVTADDVKLMPIIGGRGKQCRQGPSQSTHI